MTARPPLVLINHDVLELSVEHPERDQLLLDPIDLASDVPGKLVGLLVLYTQWVTPDTIPKPIPQVVRRPRLAHSLQEDVRFYHH